LYARPEPDVLLTLIATLLGPAVAPADTIVTLGIVERDLTGDGVVEVLSLTGVGATIDSLEVTFRIQSSGRTLYAHTWPMTRILGFEGSRRVLSDAELRAHLKEFGGWFFEESKFMTPDGFLAELRDQAPLYIAQIPSLIARARRYRYVLDSILTAGEDSGQARRKAPYTLGQYETPGNLSHATAVWEEIRAAPVIVFEYSIGGDAVTAIVWSPTDRHFYDIFNCC
jgi:hypothetical protein